jgi:hypothetical protein
VKNGGFESAVTGWTASHATLTATTPGRTSASAAQWNPDGTGDSVLTLLTAAVDAPADDNWCAVAWVKTGDTADISLTLLRSGDVLAESGDAITAGVWTRLEARGLALFAKPLSVSLTSAADAGMRQIQVDDVAVWKAPTSLCTTAP